jgi:hypothetical protein
MLKFLVLSFLVSCSTFRTSHLENLSTEKKVQLLSILGEGKGRLSVQKQNYLFDVDALMKADSWLLVATIPLHGEEVLELKDLKRKTLSQRPRDSFERRVTHAVEEMYPGKAYGQRFTRELRSLVRLVLAPTLGLKRYCEKELCVLEGESFEVQTVKNSLTLTRQDENGFRISFQGENPQDTHFEKLTFKIISPENLNVLTLEFFWKNT